MYQVFFSRKFALRRAVAECGRLFDILHYCFHPLQKQSPEVFVLWKRCVRWSMKKVFSCEIWEIVKNTYFEAHTANDCCHVNITLICEAFWLVYFSFIFEACFLLKKSQFWSWIYQKRLCFIYPRNLSF